MKGKVAAPLLREAEELILVKISGGEVQKICETPSSQYRSCLLIFPLLNTKTGALRIKEKFVAPILRKAEEPIRPHYN